MFLVCPCSLDEIIKQQQDMRQMKRLCDLQWMEKVQSQSSLPGLSSAEMETQFSRWTEWERYCTTGSKVIHVWRTVSTTDTLLVLLFCSLLSLSSLYLPNLCRASRPTQRVISVSGIWPSFFMNDALFVFHPWWYLFSFPLSIPLVDSLSLSLHLSFCLSVSLRLSSCLSPGKLRKYFSI